MTTPDERKRKNNAERQRRYRKRQRAELTVVGVPLDADGTVELLLDKGLLEPHRAADKEAVGKAIADFLADAVAKRYASLGDWRG